MTPEQIEATRPAFEVVMSAKHSKSAPESLNELGVYGDYLNVSMHYAWSAWQAAKADTLAQADHPEAVLDMVQPDHVEHALTMVEPVWLSAAEVYMLWSRDNGLEDADMCKLSDFDRVVRAIEAALHAKGHAPSLLTALQLIASTDPVDAALDPQRAVRVAQVAVAATHAPAAPLTA